MIAKVIWWTKLSQTYIKDYIFKTYDLVMYVVQSVV